MDKKYQEKRKIIEQYFISKKKLLESEFVEVSPSGNFQLEVHRYSTGPNTWDFSRGIVTRTSDNSITADVKRNYGHFWHTWVEHPNGNEYLLCGEDYQGYSIVNLTNGKYLTYFPQAGHKGGGFCWTKVYPSPDNFVLAVDGCYWASPYDLVMFDFRNPDELPYKEMTRISNIDKCEGWTDNYTFVLKQEIEFRKSDGALYDELSEEDQDVLDKDLSLLGYRYDIVHFKRPPFDKDA